MEENGHLTSLGKEIRTRQQIKTASDKKHGTFQKKKYFIAVDWRDKLGKKTAFISCARSRPGSHLISTVIISTTSNFTIRIINSWYSQLAKKSK